MTAQADHVLILAGEASGDRLAADVAEQLKLLQPEVQISGMGGQLMKQAGVDIIIDNKDMDIIGFTEVVTKWPTIRRAYRAIKRHIREHRPKTVILVDYPGFNLRMCKVAKKAGCQVLFYVSPQIWAWRYGRIKTIQRHVDHMAVLLPFEKKLYQNAGVNVSFVGHPMFKRMQSLPPQSEDNTPSEKTIALLPGSRPKELRLLLPVMIQSAKLIHAQHPHIRFVLPLAPTFQPEQLKVKLPHYIDVVTQDHYQHIRNAVCAICTSGTVTLETALLNTPHVIIYKTSWLNYTLGKWLIRSPYIGLSNIVAQQRLAPELIQKNATAQRIAKSLSPMITNRRHRELIEKKYAALCEQFSDHEPSSTLATISLQPSL